MSTIEDIITNAILILPADIGYIIPHAVDIVIYFITVVTFVFLATQFTQTRRLEEGYHVYPWLQNNLQRSYKHTRVSIKYLLQSTEYDFLNN